MNTSCKLVPVTFAFGGNGPCGAPTLRGRTHCEKHRDQELGRLARVRIDADRAAERAKQDYFVYLSEGYDP
jgi:hypothetical protein